MNLRIQALRKEKGLSQSELAEKLGVKRQTVSTWESGIRKPPVDKLAKMCVIFSVSADYLTGKTNDRNFIKTLLTEEIDISRLNAAGVSALTEYYRFLLGKEMYTRYDI